MIACFESIVKNHSYILEVDGNTKNELLTNARKLSKALGIKDKIAWKLKWGTVSRRRKSEIKAEG